MNFDKLMTEKQKDLFWDKVDIRGDDECWLWTGMHNFDPRFSNRRGFVCLDSKRHIASRIAWSLHNKKAIPGGLFACHHCDNGLCCNPFHIFVGTQKDNMQDCAAKGRHSHGAKSTTSKLTDIGVMLCRHAHVNGLMGTVELARRCGVSSSTMSLAVTGKQWKHLPMPEKSIDREEISDG